eukprot:8151864-Alexandrium_andersonii.AAC.1
MERVAPERNWGIARAVWERRKLDRKCALRSEIEVDLAGNGRGRFGKRAVRAPGVSKLRRWAFLGALRGKLSRWGPRGR